MDGTRRLSLVVGTFVIAAFVVLAVILLSFSSERGFLQPRYRLVTYFENAQGLLGGAPVRLAGRDVGTVEFVTFAPLDDATPPVRVVLQVDTSVRDRIRSDSVASIGTIGLLGDKYVEIGMGTSQGTVLRDGADLRSISPLDLNEAVAEGSQAIRNITALAENVNVVVEDFSNAMGGRSLAEALASLESILTEVREGDGVLHGLIYENYQGDAIRSIESSLRSLEGLLAEVETGEGPLHSLIYRDPSRPDVLAEISLGVQNLNAILTKANTGDGTLALLLNDPTLYEDLKQLVGGAQQSLVVRSLIRMSTEEE